MASKSKGSYIIKLGADISAVEAAVAEAKGQITNLGDDKVLIQIDYDHGDMAAVRNAVQSIIDYDPKVRVQIQYDLESAALKKKKEELESDEDLFKMMLGESDNHALTDHVAGILREIDDGLDKGISKIDLAEKLKRAMDISESYTKYKDRDLQDYVTDWIYDLEEQLKVEDYEAKTDIFSNLRTKIEDDKAIIKGLELQLKDLRSAGAIDIDGTIDFSGIENGASGVEKLASGMKEAAQSAREAKKEIIGFSTEAKKVGESIKDVFDNKLRDLTNNYLSQLQNTNRRDLKETAFVMTKEGNIIGGTEFGTHDSDKGLNKKAIKEAREAGLTPEIGVHTHGGSFFPAPSINVEEKEVGGKLTKALSGDLFAWSENVNQGIKKEVMLGLKAINIFDSENFYSKYGEKLDDPVIADKLASEYQRVSASLKNSPTRYLEELVNKFGHNTEYTGDIFSNGLKDYLTTIFRDNFDLNNIDIDSIVKDVGSKLGKTSRTLGDIIETSIRKNSKNITDDELLDFYGSISWDDLYEKWGLKGLKETDIHDFQMIKELPGIFRRGAGIKDFDQFYKLQTHDDFYTQNPLKLDTSIPEINVPNNSSEIDDYISKLERLQQLQQTINNMKPEAAYGKSYEETGRHIEKLNAQYEQTVAEIEKLREADDGSTEIKEQIGLLENLAVAYREAMEHSFPNDVAHGDWLRKYTNLSPKDIYGDSAQNTFDRIKRSAEEFRNQINQSELDTFREATFSNEDLSKLSQETINTSALLEIPEIMERITSAGTEATQTMKEFYSAASGEGEGIGGIGSTSDSEVDSLRSELDQAEKDAEAERRRAADAEERAEQAEDEAKGYLDANTRLSNELAEERKNASEREKADAERISQLESDLSLKDDLYRIAVQDQVDSDKRAKEYEELNKDLQRQVSELQRGKQANESTDNLGQESSNTAGGIDNESEALTRLASIALTAAANKDLVTQSNISLASQMTASTSKILEEAEALDKLAQNAKKAADEKKGFTNNAKEAEPAEEKTKKNTESKGKKKKDYEREYLSSIDKFKKLAQDGALEQLLPDRYSSLRQQLNSIEPNAYSIDKFNDSLKETATLLSDVKKRHVEIEKASEKGYMKAISEYTNSEQDLLKYLPDSAEQLKKELNSIEPNTASIDQFMSHLEEARSKMDGMRQSFDMWRYSFDEANILNSKIQNNSHLNELFGQRMSDIEDKTPYIDPYDTEGVEKYHDEVKSLALDLQRVKDTAAENVNSGISAIDQLAKDRNQYINALVKTADGKGTDALKDIIQNYNSELDGIKQRIADIKAEWGEDDHNANRFQKYFDLYQSDTAEKTRIRLLADAQAKQQKITNAQTSSTDFVPAFTAELKSAHDSVDSIVKEISGADVSKFFDEKAVEKWVDSLKNAQNTIDNIKKQENISATENQLQTLMRRINTDISHRGLRGTLADEYSDLKSRVEAAAAAIRDADDAAEAVSKIDMKGLVTEWSALNAKAREAGQLSDGFAKKFSEAINNQSAQFLATYFSFQDMVRYAKEISQTVVQTDSALVELRKVSNESNDRIQESFQKSAETAQEMGSTVTDVVNSTADWSRLGYNIEDAEELARVTTLFQKVGDNMTQESASQSLVSMLQGFQMDASQSERIVDSVNEVANNFAIDTAGIGDALQRSAAAFNAAGTDLNKSIALVTTANAVVQDPASVGTMFKTMSARIRGQCRPIYSEGYSPQCVINAA